jgi:hypothetical protein
MRDTPAVLLVEDEQSIRDILVEPFDTDLDLAGKRDGGLQVMAAAGIRSASDRLGAKYFLAKPADLAAPASLATRHGVRTSLDAG